MEEEGTDDPDFAGQRPVTPISWCLREQREHVLLSRSARSGVREAAATGVFDDGVSGDRVQEPRVARGDRNAPEEQVDAGVSPSEVRDFPVDGVNGTEISLLDGS